MIAYQEKQRFMQWYILVPLTLALIWVLTTLFGYEGLLFSFGRPGYEKLLPGLLPTALVAFTLAFIIAITLTTTITSNYVIARFNILGGRQIKTDEIQRVELGRYSFVGFGRRISFKYGHIINVSGNFGALVYYGDNKKLLIGTNKVDEFTDAWQKLSELKGFPVELKHKIG